MNRSQKNNNPGNIKISKPVGEATAVDDRGFAIFPSPCAGWRALHREIDLEKRRGKTVREFIREYAPENENNTSNYLNFVCTQLRVKDDTPLADVSKYALAGVIASMEGYYSV